MNLKNLLKKSLLVGAALLAGTSGAWADPIETVGTEGTGDEWASRKYSSAYQLSPGETYHFTFTNHNYGSTTNYHNWFLDCYDSNAKDGGTGFPTGTHYFALRPDVHGWGTYYSGIDATNVQSSEFLSIMDGGVVDMYINFNSSDKVIRLYSTTTSSDGTKTFYYNAQTKPIDVSSVYLFFSEEKAYLEITKATKESRAINTDYIYKRSATSGYFYTWAATDANGTEPGSWICSYSDASNGITIDPTLGLKHFIKKNGQTASLTLNPESNSILTYDAVWNVGTASFNGNDYHTYLQIGSNIKFKFYTETRDAQSNNKSLDYVINGNTVKFAAKGTIEHNTDINIHLAVNTNTLTITELSVMKGATELLKLSDLSEANKTLTAGTTFSKVILGTNFAVSSNTMSTSLKSLDIQQRGQDVAKYGYTVNYKKGGEIVKTISDAEASEGSPIPVLRIITGDDGYDYIVTDVDLPSQTVVDNTIDADANVINLNVRKRYTATLTVKYSLDGVVDEDFTTNTVLAESESFANAWTYVFPYYIKRGNTYYKASLKGAKSDEFGETGSFEYEDILKTVTYTSDPLVCNYSDLENGAQGTDLSSSNGHQIILTKETGIGTYAAGTYTITFVSDDTRKFQVLNGETVVVDNVQSDTYEFTLSTTATLTIKRASGNMVVDYYVVKMKGVPATIGANGFTTFASTYPLNLTTATLPTGVTAYYKAAVDGTKVNFTALNQTVPANTGVLIEGTPNTTVYIPVVAEGTAVAGNDFLVNTSDAVFDAEGGYTYYAMMKDSNPLTFGTFNPATLAFPATKAYLKVAAGGGARLYAAFGDDETTGINSVQGSGLKVNGSETVYNLQGQRVAAPQKGLYIINGKKVIVK